MSFFADLHCDTLFEGYVSGRDLNCQTHINTGNIEGFSKYLQTFAFFVPEKTERKKEFLFDFIEYGRAFLRQNGFVFDFAESAPRQAVLAVENCDVFADERDVIPTLDALCSVGIRIFSLVYNHDNPLGSGALSAEDNGLTALGKNVLLQAEKRGLIPDVSHASYRTTEDVLSVCRGPVLATHSNARGICDHPRNLSDEHIRRIADSGGLIGVNLYPPFLRGDTAEIEDVFRHIKHILSLAGEDHIAFGCDFDGVEKLPHGICDLGSVRALREAAESYGIPEDTANKIFYGNVSRFMREHFGGKR